jgi:SAM-dependent methyltransferase
MVASYTPGHGDSVTAFMGRRSATSHAAFLLPHLQAHWRLLDVGCGPGSITADLAALLTAGSVLGIDMNAGQVARAQELARQRGLGNAQFAPMSLGALNLPRESFDLVFAHAVFEHLAAPDAALGELRDVIRPGGMIALRSPDWGGLVLHPQTADLPRALAAYETLQRGNGGDLRVGRRLAGWLDDAGFVAIARSASYQIYEEATFIADYLADQLEGAGQREAGAILRAWAGLPGATFAQPWFEAIGRKPGNIAGVGAAPSGTA